MSAEHTEFGAQHPHLVTSIPGPKSQAWIDRLALRECPAITARRARRAQSLGTAKDDPIVWHEAMGANVRDVDGNVFVDLTAGFGVAAVGHRNPTVVAAAQAQSEVLLHAMGDAFADPKRIELMEKLAEISGLDRAILGCSGSDSVEAAIKTARMATGRDKLLAFDNSYHGLAFGPLSASDYKSDMFREPFKGQLGQHVEHATFNGNYPAVLTEFAAILVEPIQGRGGVRPANKSWLRELIQTAHRDGCVVIFDEIYTGCGRTGRWFAFQHPELTDAQPDLVCIGKAMAGGFPISACLGTAKVMDAWGASKGESIHTQTFLGNPMGCAMGLAALSEIERIQPELDEKMIWLQAEFDRRGYTVRGEGFLWGIQLPDTLTLSRKLMELGYIILPAGPKCEVLALTAPYTITKEQLLGFLDALDGLTK